MAALWSARLSRNAEATTDNAFHEARLSASTRTARGDAECRPRQCWGFPSSGAGANVDVFEAWNEVTQGLENPLGTSERETALPQLASETRN